MAGECVEDRGRVLEDVVVVVAAVEVAGPRVEELERRRAGGELHIDERRGDARELGQEEGEGLGVGDHERLRLLVVLARSAFDEVARQGERGPGEADERGVGAEFGGDAPDRFGDVGNLVGFELGQGLDVGAGADRCGEHRSAAGDDLDLDAGRLEGDDDVGEEDRGVDSVTTHGLEGDLGDEFGVPAGVEHRGALAQSAVLGQGATGLPHEPDGGVIDRLSPQSRQQS
ncbi:Uncharacterised protein [Mycobacteroides abscessus subsp. abscessus]|nr:Uncharacterised protein [Mycobacteroides abscessus subsp. abscessus]